MNNNKSAVNRALLVGPATGWDISAGTVHVTRAGTLGRGQLMLHGLGHWRYTYERRHTDCHTCRVRHDTHMKEDTQTVTRIDTQTVTVDDTRAVRLVLGQLMLHGL